MILNLLRLTNNAFSEPLAGNPSASDACDRMCSSRLLVRNAVHPSVQPIYTNCAPRFRLRVHRIGTIFQEEEVVLTAAARAEEAARKAEAKQKRQQEFEVKEAERDAAEMADLMVSDPEVPYVFC